MGKVTGVYVPFWVFSGDVKGTLGYKAQTSSSSRSGDYIITQTNHYQLVRDAALSFDNLPVDASGRIDDRLMDSLEPFNTAETKPFDMRYLAGFTADRLHGRPLRPEKGRHFQTRFQPDEKQHLLHR